MNAWAVILSVIPGLGHLRLGRTKKGISLLIMTAATIAGIVFSRWILFKIVASGIYASLVINAVWETYSVVYRKKEVKDSPAYILFLVLTSGFSALPLLWQSQAFSRRAKIGWTIAVPVFAGFFFGFLFFFGGNAEAWLSGVRR